MPGSNGFVRTQRVNGPAESDALTKPVHMAISYKQDGTITMFRNGEPYGKPYVSSGLVKYPASDTVINLGLRHSPAGSNHNLTGKIIQAELYAQALSADVIKGIATGQRFYISDKLVRESLSVSEREQVDALAQKIDAIRKQLAGIQRPANTVEPVRQAWRDYAQSIFNLKEFIFIR